MRAGLERIAESIGDSGYAGLHLSGMSRPPFYTAEGAKDAEEQIVFTSASSAVAGYTPVELTVATALSVVGSE
jgi:hypothetical protein